jgi:ABC-2 type transport system ATP-binding protein
VQTLNNKSLADTRPTAETIVETNHLTKQFGELTALDDLSISIRKGEILGFIGPNGAGKTTTIKILVGLSRPTSGSASICGADCVAQSRKIKRLVGYMPDRFGSYENMRVSEYLDFFAAAFRVPWLKRRRRIDEVLQITNAEYMRDRYVETLSHGMQQRVGIARTLLHDPEVLILDEPANGLDPQARVDMRDLLLRLAAAGKTLIVTSHILPELSRICDQVAIITHGKLRAFGPLSEIMSDVSQLRVHEVQLGRDVSLEHAASRIAQTLPDAQEIVASETEQMIRFKSTAQDDQLGDVLSALVHDGIRVNQFRELQADLEDAFLSVTQEEPAKNEQAATPVAVFEEAVEMEPTPPTDPPSTEVGS